MYCLSHDMIEISAANQKSSDNKPERSNLFPDKDIRVPYYTLYDHK